MLKGKAAGLAVSVIVLLGCREGSESPTGPETPLPQAAAVAAPLAFVQVSTGGFHSCGVTTAGKAFCWGGNGAGQLGDGTVFFNQSRTTPKAVIGGLRFRHVTAGYEHTCGVTTDDRVYCWGQNFFGQLGNGTQGSDHFQVSTPAEVVGGRRFRQVRAGFSHTCAITLADVAFCWGENIRGQIGDGTSGINRPRPVRVLGDQKWAFITGGAAHTCAVTRSDQLFCWGWNEHGQLGNGSRTNRTRPTPVSGGRLFREVEAGGEHTCGVTNGDLAYCWGRNFAGSLGDGTETERLTPGAVAGARRFAHVNAGEYHTCGVTRAGRGLCWGLNSQGQVGDGTLGSRSLPVPLALTPDLKQLDLKQIAASNIFHTCGITTDNRAYCWGAGGLLGDGTTTQRLSPVPVVGPS